MKKKTIIATIATTVALAGALTFGTIQTHASATAEQEVQQVTTQWLDAIVSKNAEEAAKYVKDVRFKDLDATVEGYKKIMVQDPLTDYKILDVNAKNPTHVTVTLEYTTELAGIQQMDVSAKKISDTWKISMENIKTVKAKK